MDLGIENLISSFASSISFIIHLEYFPHWTLSSSLNFPVNPRREQYQQRETERCLTMPNNHYNSLFPTPRALTFVQQQIRYHSSQGSPRWNDSNLDFQRTWPLSRRLQRCKFYFAVAVARTMHTRAYRSCTRRRGHSSLLPFPPLSPPLSLLTRRGPVRADERESLSRSNERLTARWCIGSDLHWRRPRGNQSASLSLSLSLPLSWSCWIPRLSSRPRKNEPWRSGINRFTVTGRITGDTSWRLIPRALIKNSLVYVSSSIDGYFIDAVICFSILFPRVVQWKKEVIACISYFFG